MALEIGNIYEFKDDGSGNGTIRVKQITETGNNLVELSFLAGMTDEIKRVLTFNETEALMESLRKIITVKKAKDDEAADARRKADRTRSAQFGDH